MPSLQLDVNASYPTERKRELAQRLGATYAQIMRTRPETITVAVHAHGEGNVWRCTDEEPISSSLLMCDIRRGRSTTTRERLSRALLQVCAETLGLDPQRIKIEYTQHAGDEMFHPQLGGFNRDWTAEEPTS